MNQREGFTFYVIALLTFLGGVVLISQGVVNSSWLLLLLGLGLSLFGVYGLKVGLNNTYGA